MKFLNEENLFERDWCPGTGQRFERLQHKWWLYTQHSERVFFVFLRILGSGIRKQSQCFENRDSGCFGSVNVIPKFNIVAPRTFSIGKPFEIFNPPVPGGNPSQDKLFRQNFLTKKKLLYFKFQILKKTSKFKTP